MATSIREQILTAVDAALIAIGAGVLAARNRSSDVEPAEMPAAIQIDGGHRASDHETGAVGMTLDVSVQGYVTGSDDAAITAAVDALYVQIGTALMADITLGGLASDVREVEMLEPEIMREEQEKPFAEFTVEFEIDYQTSETDPTALP